MAPSFLSKLVKASPTHNRERSDRSLDLSASSSRRSLSPAARTRVISSISAIGTPSEATPTQTPSPPNSKIVAQPKTTNRVPSINAPQSVDNQSETSSINPNVTIIPPSPRSTDKSGLPTEIDGDQPSVEGLPVSSNAGSKGDTAEQKRATSSAPANPPEPSSMSSSSFFRKPKSRPTTPSSSTPSLPDVSNPPPPLPTSNGTLKTPDNSLRKSASNKSLNQLPSITTSPPSVHSRTPSVPTGKVELDEAGMTPIVESPTSMTEFGVIGSLPTPTAATVNGTGGTYLSSLSASPPRDTDALSMHFTATGANNSPPSKAAPKKKETARPWRRPSTKPTGLAGAIAASGLAMANPAFSAQQQAQLSPPITGIAPIARSATNSSRKGSVGSPSNAPYLIRTASGSGGASSSTQFSPPRSSKSRHSSIGSGGKKRSMSVSDHGSEYVPEHGVDYYSGLEDDSDEEEDDESSGDDLEGINDMEDIPVTGFAVASSRRNTDFHELFPSIPEGDYLIEDYGCALQREILIQGRLYISENHICFHANILGWVTDLSIPIYEIVSLEKKMTAFVIPNAILITTRQTKYTFASFLSRDTTFDVIYNIWRLSRPGDAASIGSNSVERGVGQIVEGTIIGTAGGVNGDGVLVPGPAAVNKVTQCTCGRDKKHYTETAMDAVFPGTPEKIYNLMFASGFIKDFLAIDQKLIDLQMSDWAPTTEGSKLLARNMTYIKPLNGSVGPKQTKCEIRDETVICDFDDYVSTVTTTRTPDVPSGGVFSVKTRTCITWASSISSRVLVTTQVEWTGRSFIKGLIERGAIDGQKTYHNDLEKAMLTYIQDHQTEFIPEGVAITAIAPVPPTPIANGESVRGALSKEGKTPEQRERDRNRLGMQWAWDTFDGAFSVAKQSTKGALELIKDSWDQSSTTTILYFIIVALVFSNIWTWMRVPKEVPSSSSRRTVIGEKDKEEREKWIQGVVTALWDELAAGKGRSVGLDLPEVATLSSRTGMDQGKPVDETRTISAEWRDEIVALHATMDIVEQRVRSIREGLNAAKTLSDVD